MESPPYFIHQDDGAQRPSTYMKVTNLSGTDWNFYGQYLSMGNNNVFYREVVKVVDGQIVGGRKYRGGCEMAPRMGFRAFENDSPDNDDENDNRPEDNDVVTTENPDGHIEVYLKFTVDTMQLLVREFMALRDGQKAEVLHNSDPNVRDQMMTTHLALRRASGTPEVEDALKRTNKNKYVAFAAFVDTTVEN